MKIKTFTSTDKGKLDQKVNQFINEHDISVKDIKFSNPLLYYAAMVMYKE